jgi:hypothetical protein
MMAATLPTSPTNALTAPGRTGRLRAWASVALGVTVLGLGSLATPAVADTGDPSPGVIECRSGVMTDGDVSMSALTVTRAPTTLPTSPGDCSDG